MSKASDVDRYFEERDRSGEMEAELGKLVRENSFTSSREGGHRVGEILAQSTFAIEGLHLARRESTGFAAHLVFRSEEVPSRAAGEAVALVGHLDTVFPPGTFEGMLEDGNKLRGPGVLDMKGGLVVVATALRAIATTVGLGAIKPVLGVIVSDEEVGSPEGQQVIAEAARGSSEALVFEAGRERDAIILERKGTGAVKLTARGVSAHAGISHEMGRNAIWALSRWIDRAQALTRYELGTTINVGKIAGGIGKNTVPDFAEAEIDLRFVTKDLAEALVAALALIAKEVEKELPGTTLELEGGIARLPLERTKESESLAARYAVFARASGLGGEFAGRIGGGSDASTTSALGIPTIDGLGPRGLGFHTKDEWIDRTSLVPKAWALARFLSSR